MNHRRITALAVFVVAGAWLLGTSLGRAAQDQTLEGVVSNTHCGLRHNTASADAKGCISACIKNGAKYALVVKDKVYTLAGQEAEAEKLAAEFEGSGLTQEEFCERNDVSRNALARYVKRYRRAGGRCRPALGCG